MSGSSASNLGYGKIVPNSNVNGDYVNKDNSNWSGGFSSNEIPTSSLFAYKNNVDAAAASAIRGGGIARKHKKSFKIHKYKINNIAKMYKMNSRKGLKRRINSLKSKLRSLSNRYNKAKSRAHKKTMRKQRKTAFRGMTLGRSLGFSQRGGTNNVPDTPTYALASTSLSASQSALANPPIYTVLPNCTNCVDNYNHYTNKGFPSPSN